jgi:hypothetical protein
MNARKKTPAQVKVSWFAALKKNIVLANKGNLSNWAMVVVTVITAIIFYFNLSYQRMSFNAQQKQLDLLVAQNRLSVRPDLRIEFIKADTIPDSIDYSYKFVSKNNTAYKIRFLIYKMPQECQFPSFFKSGLTISSFDKESTYIFHIVTPKDLGIVKPTSYINRVDQNGNIISTPVFKTPKNFKSADFMFLTLFQDEISNNYFVKNLVSRETILFDPVSLLPNNLNFSSTNYRFLQKSDKITEGNFGSTFSGPFNFGLNGTIIRNQSY